MTSDCNNKNTLQRSGVSQYKRVLEALLPTHVRVDERDHADLILFAKNYARQLKYFNVNNIADDDWHALMGMDVSVTLAVLMKLNVKGCFAHVKDLFRMISETDSIEVADLKDQFKILFDTAFSFTKILNDHYKALPSDFPFKAVFGATIHSNLPEYYNRLKEYYVGAVALGLIDETNTYSITPTPVEIILSQNFDEIQLDAKWVDGAIPPFIPTFNGLDAATQIKNTSTHNLFTGIFDTYLKTLAVIVDTAGDYLETTLENFPTHTPHYALYLTFIKLFKYAQDHVNQFTKWHLDLYYKEILKLTNKEAEPDSVHLTFELAKTVNENHFLKKDTAFKAGKDSDGQEIFYALQEDVVLNKGAVNSLKGVFVDHNINQGTKQVFASPVVNSEDGQGADLESVDKSWKTFGDSERTPATIGFVVASRYLYLTEGDRTITFTFYARPGNLITFTQPQIRDRFSLQLSGEKGWIDVLVDPSKVIVHPSKTYFTLTVSLDGGIPAVTPYTQDVHESNFKTSLPVAKFTVNDAKAKLAVWNFEFDKVGITVDVKGMKDVAVENNGGTLNPAKPFEPFGSVPVVGSSFIIGSKEILMKTLQPVGKVNVAVNLIWDNLSELNARVDTSTNKTVDIYYLEDAKWSKIGPSVKLFDAFSKDISVGVNPGFHQFFEMQNQIVQQAPLQFFPLIESNPAQNILTNQFATILPNYFYLFGYKGSTAINIELPLIDVGEDFTENEYYTSKSKWGFLKIELNNDLGHATYAKRLSDAAKNAKITSIESPAGTFTTDVDIDTVTEPYTPKVKDFTIDYVADTLIDFSSGEEGTFIHITPFGSKDLSIVTNRYLLPPVNKEGEFYIGIENFTTEQTLSVLFQVAEGSADPLSVKQDVDWYFLRSGNDWTSFAKEDIADGTNDLTQSGIIKFSLSDAAGTENTLMSESLHWLKGTVTTKTNAVCKLIDVVAQAAKVTFVDYRGTGNYFKNTLASGLISKSVVSDAGLKKINQPYASFNGRVKESDEHFYVRVSERLRHKNRGITMWDYERLVLEAFPSIYKAKCINHTQVVEKTSGTQTIYIDNELKPGYVLLVPIPDLQNKNAFDPLRPYTSLGVMAEIRQYLYNYISPHVNLDVRNPRFEEIQLEFAIKYLTEDNEFYTRQLKEELQEFMAPWAYDPETDIEFGGKISKSVLIDFIEERSYVDHLSCVQMYQIVEGVKSGNLDEAIATSSRSVFVSVKSDDLLHAHAISFLQDQCDC